MPLLLLPCTCTHAYSEPWVDVDPTATTLGSFVKNPAQVEPVQIKALLEASASAYRSGIMATARTSPAVSRPARYKPKPLAFSHLPNMPPAPDAETSRKLAASMLAALPADGTTHQLSLLDYLRQFYPEVVPATGPQPNVPLLFVLGCCTSGPYQAVGVFSTLPRMLQVDTVAEAAADLQASQVEVLTFTDGSYEVMSAKLVLPSTVSVWGTAAVGIPAFNVKNLEFLMTVDTTLRLIHLEAHGQATVSGLPRPFDVVLGRRLVADGSLLRAHDMAAAAKITFRQEPMDWAALNVAFKGMFKGALGQQSSDMPAIVGGIASLGAGGFELEEIGLATGLRVCRVIGVIDTSRLTTSFSWSAVLPGDLGTALSSKVGIQGGTAELSMYSPAYQQVIGLALDNFVFTAPSGGAVSISLDRQPDAVSSTAPPTLDWLLCAKPAAGNAKPVTLADFAALLGPVGVATEGIPGLEAVLESVLVKQLYIELNSANGAIKLESISVKAEIAPLTLLPGVLTLKDATDIDLSWSRGIDDTGYWAGSMETVMELFGSLDVPVILNLPNDYSYGGLSIQNPCRGSMPGLALQEVAKGFGWTLPTFTELDISKYLPLEVQLAEITLDVGPNDQGLVVAGVIVVLRVGEMNIAPFNLKEAELTISDWLQPLPDGTSAVSAQLTGVVGAGNDNVSFSLTYNDNPTPVTPALPRFLPSGTRVLPYPIPDPKASYRFGGSLTVLRTEQPDAMALPAATERLGLGISADDQLLHGSVLWAVTLAMGERIPISSSAQLLGLKAVVKKQPEGAQFGVSASLAIGDWRLAVAAAYSRPDNLIAISVSAEDQGFAVLGAFSSDLASKYGLTVPTPGAPGNANPGLVSASVDLATDLQFSLRKFELQVQGRWTIGQIASVIGLPWPLANDFITLEGAALRYVPTDFQTPGGGPKLLAQFVVAASMDIPALHATKLNAAVVVSAGAGVAIQLSGTWKPIMGVEIDNAALAVKGGVGLLLSSAGRVFGTGFTITITASQGGMDFMAHADKINLGGILKSLVPDIPDFLFGFCKALSFAQVNVGYVNGAFTLLAVPDVLSSPELQAILKVTGFTQDDIHLSTGSSGTGTSLSVVKGLTLNLPAPFVGPAELHFSLAVSDKVPGSIMFSGSFAAGLDVFGQGVLHFELTAGVYVPQLLLYFKGATTAPFALKAFPFITLDSLYLEATIDVAVEPPAPVELAFNSATQLFGATTNNVIKYDTLSNQFALLSDIEHAGVQQALASVGVNVDLSGFNLEMSQVKLSFAEKAVVVDKQPVPQGLFLGGDVSLFGLLDTTVKLQLTVSGATFGLTVDDTELVKIAKQVSDEVQKALDAASDKVDSAKKDAQQKLEAAKQKVADAEAAVVAAQSAFDDAKQKAAAGLAAAQQALETSQAAFDAAEKSAKDAVDAAQRDVDSAQSAFDSAKAAATAALNNAQAQADAADRAFDDAKASVQGPLDSAQNAVNSLQSQLDGLSCSIWHPQDCAEEAALEPVLEAAKVTLDGAQAAFNAVMNGAQAATKATADAALEAAQQAMQQVLNGSAYVALNTAKAALAAAQTAAQAVLSGSQAAALASAKTARDLAQAAADAVLNGAQAAALKTAEGVLEAANGVLTGAEATAAATLDLCARATKDLGHLLSLALTLFALLKLDLHFQLTPTLLAVHAAMDVSVEGRVLPQLAFYLQLKDPLGQLVQLVAKGVVDGVRAAYDSLSSFL
ncbi:hypothetical protein D9Q98_000090 [Chlorella vulgaris]|uniref:Uncharacterized protein n=1 Tax=Chlorella vulgaris TaxID=3077 RepID=A0A9D4TXK5_CHLVU|nr:hypothetical protein D9Q98_000090 [Chlorella vulgaris]